MKSLFLCLVLVIVFDVSNAKPFAKSISFNDLTYVEDASQFDDIPAEDTANEEHRPEEEVDERTDKDEIEREANSDVQKRFGLSGVTNSIKGGINKAKEEVGKVVDKVKTKGKGVIGSIKLDESKLSSDVHKRFFGGATDSIKNKAKEAVGKIVDKVKTKGKGAIDSIKSDESESYGY